MHQPDLLVNIATVVSDTNVALVFARMKQSQIKLVENCNSGEAGCFRYILSCTDCRRHEISGIISLGNVLENWTCSRVMAGADCKTSLMFISRKENSLCLERGKLYYTFRYPPLHLILKVNYG